MCSRWPPAPHVVSAFGGPIASPNGARNLQASYSASYLRPCRCALSKLLGKRNDDALRAANVAGPV